MGMLLWVLAVWGHSFSEKLLKVYLTGLAFSGWELTLQNSVKAVLFSLLPIPTQVLLGSLAAKLLGVYSVTDRAAVWLLTHTPSSCPDCLKGWGKVLGDYVLTCFIDPQKDLSRKPRSLVSTPKAGAEFWLCLPDETAGWEWFVRRLEEG